jgi:hypothetical protein
MALAARAADACRVRRRVHELAFVPITGKIFDTKIAPFAARDFDPAYQDSRSTAELSAFAKAMASVGGEL